MDCMLPKYRPTKEEFDEMWNKCVFIPDTSLLLGLYRYSSGLRVSIINIFEKISDRLWIPHQVALEYYDNRDNVIDEEVKKYNVIKSIITENVKNIDSQLNKKDLFKKYEETSEITKDLVRNINRGIEKELEAVSERYPKRETFEGLDDAIIKLFIGKVGTPYSLKKLEDVSKIGFARYELKLPPGYKDKGKGGIKDYVDLIVWFQIMEMAKDKKHPIILILDDLKEDWWWISSGKIVGPRPELIQEFASEVNLQFYMYSTDQFLKYAKQYIDTNIKDEVIEEAKEYRDDEERRLREIEASEAIRLVDLASRFPSAAMLASIAAAQPSAETLASMASAAYSSRQTLANIIALAQPSAVMLASVAAAQSSAETLASIASAAYSSRQTLANIAALVQPSAAMLASIAAAQSSAETLAGITAALSEGSAAKSDYSIIPQEKETDVDE